MPCLVDPLVPKHFQEPWTYRGPNTAQENSFELPKPHQITSHHCAKCPTFFQQD